MKYVLEINFELLVASLILVFRETYLKKKVPMTDLFLYPFKMYALCIGFVCILMYFYLNKILFTPK